MMVCPNSIPTSIDVNYRNVVYMIQLYKIYCDAVVDDDGGGGGNDVFHSIHSKKF